MGEKAYYRDRNSIVVIKFFLLQLGSVGFLLITIMTSHCCQLIVKIKYIIINEYCLQYQASHSDGRYGPYTSSKKFRKTLQKHLDYPDIGRVLYGKWGAGIVKMFLVLTQFGFCVNYHIFLGNTLYGMIQPPVKVTAGNDSANTDFIPILDHENSTVQKEAWWDVAMTTPIESIQPAVDANTRGPDSSKEPWMPPLSLLVVCPLPLFLIFVLIRKVRKMAPISLMANSAATVAYFLVIGYISAGKWKNVCCGYFIFFIKRFFCI